MRVSGCRCPLRWLGCKGLASLRTDVSAAFLEEQVLLFLCCFHYFHHYSTYQGWSLGFNTSEQHTQIRLLSTEL